MGTPTLEPIATTTLGSAASSITFGSIPSTYTDLRVVLSGATTAPTHIWMRINADAGSNYSSTELVGTGSAASSGKWTDVQRVYLTVAAYAYPNPVLYKVDFLSYSSSQFKTFLLEESGDQNGSGATSRLVGLWRSTAAISSLLFYVDTDSLAAGTTATLYGIKAA